MAGDARPGGRRAARGVRALARASGYSGTVIMLVVPLAAVHGHPDLRRARTAAELVARSVDRPRRQGGSHVPQVVLPQLRPSIVAGSIFTFALTLGDFYMTQIVGGTTQFIGNVVYREFSVEPAVRGGVRDAADRDHGRATCCGRARVGRARGAVAVYVSRAARYAARRVHGAGPVRPVLPDPLRRPALVQHGAQRSRGRRRASRSSGGEPRRTQSGPREALLRSLETALLASAIALVLGTLASFALTRHRFFGRNAVSFIVVLPIALPGHRDRHRAQRRAFTASASTSRCSRSSSRTRRSAS